MNKFIFGLTNKITQQFLWSTMQAFLALNPLRLLPIKRNRVLFIVYAGTGYCCNPKYIAEYLNTNYKYDFELFFTVTDKKRMAGAIPKGIRTVKYLSFMYFLCIFTAKIVITNASMTTLSNRRGQMRIQTWHGGGAYKYAGVNVSMFTPQRGMQVAKKTNLFLSSSKEFTKVLIKGGFLYHGELLCCGMPRNDFLVKNGHNTEMVRKIHNLYKIPDQKGILLYAPTFRDHGRNVAMPIFNRLIESLQERFNRAGSSAGWQ